MALARSRTEIRAAVEANRNLKDEGERSDAIRGFEEVRELLSEHIVQGRLNERDNYEVEMKPDMDDGGVFEPLPINQVELEKNNKS